MAVTIESLTTDVNGFFLFTMAIFVFLLHLGFGMVEIAIAKKTTVIEVMLKNFINLTVGALVYWAFGFLFAYGGDFNEHCKSCNGFIGVENPFLIGLPGKELTFWFFAYTIGTVAIGIVGNSVAERLHFPAYFALAIIVTGWVQPIVFHWIWSTQGWLSLFAPASKTLFGKAYLDFAGAGCIHLVGGCHAVVGALMTGKRHNYYKESELQKYKNAHHFLPRFQYDKEKQKWNVNSNILHNPLAQSIGIWILWTAWYGFNNASMIMLTNKNVALGRVLVCTAIGAGAGGVVAVFFGRIVSHEFDILDLCNGTLVGLVGNGAACAFVQPWAAVCIGAIAGVIYKCACALYVKFRIDDPCDAGPIHGFCGLWGAIAVAFFADPKLVDEVSGFQNRGGGVFYGYGSTLAVHLIGTVCIIAWSTSWACLVYGIMRRVDRDRRDDAIFFIKNTTPPGVTLEQVYSTYGFGLDKFVKPKSEKKTDTGHQLLRISSPMSSKKNPRRKYIHNKKPLA